MLSASTHITSGLPSYCYLSANKARPALGYQPASALSRPQSLKCNSVCREGLNAAFLRRSFAILLGTLVTALKSIARSLSISFDQAVEIVTDAPQYDWELFCDLAYDDGHWPRIVRNFPTDATMLSPTSEGEELPHHALLDARIIAGMFAPVCGGSGLS